MSSTPELKRALRRRLREQRRAIDPHTRDRAGKALGDRLSGLGALAGTRHIAAYVAADGEIDPAAGIELLRRMGKQIYLPVISDGKQLEFAHWREGETLAPNRLGIPEPPATAARRDVRSLDAVLMPLVGWTHSGARLGMGGGFYDRSLATAEGVIKIGLAFEAQGLASLPEEQWDVRMDFIVTEAASYACDTTAKY